MNIFKYNYSENFEKSFLPEGAACEYQVVSTGVSVC